MSPQAEARPSSETATSRDGRSDRQVREDDDRTERWPSDEGDESHCSRGGWLTIALGILAVAVVTGAIYGWRDRDRQSDSGKDQHSSKQGQGQDQNQAALRVKVVHPHQGGMTRTTTQPGTLHAFQYADLYAKASGYLRAQVVDIGDTVEKGQVLAEVYDPERQQQVELTAAEVERAKAAVQQAQARKTAAEAQVQATEAAVAVRKTEVSQTAAIRRFREKEFIRYVELARRQAVDQRVADEKQEDFEGAKAAEERAARFGQGRRSGPGQSGGSGRHGRG